MENEIALFVGSLDKLVLDFEGSALRDISLLFKKMLCDVKQHASDVLGVRIGLCDTTAEDESMAKLELLCERLVSLCLNNKEVLKELEAVKQEIYDVYVDFLCQMCDNGRSVYVIDSYYSTNHLESCIIVETDKTVKEMVEICGALNFLFEDAIVAGARPTFDLQPKQLLSTLTGYFDMVDCKGMISRGILSRLIPTKHHMFDDPYRFYDGLPFVLDIRGELPDKLPDFVIDLSGVGKALYCNRDAVIERWLPVEARDAFCNQISLNN